MHGTSAVLLRGAAQLEGSLQQQTETAQLAVPVADIEFGDVD